MLYKYSPKILFAEFEKDIFREYSKIFSTSADVFFVEYDNDDGCVRISDQAGEKRELQNPLTGPTVLVNFQEIDNDFAHQINSIWNNANLEPPTHVSLNERSVSPITISQNMLDIQSGIVTDAMRRNVDLLAQVATLRQHCEDMNTVADGLIDLMNLRQSNRRNLLFSSNPIDLPITLKPGQSLTQRLPVVILPSLIGAISTPVKAERQTRISAKIVPVDANWTEEVRNLDIEPGRQLLFAAFEKMVNPNSRVINFILTNTGDHDVELEQALLESPDERAEISGTDRSDIWSIRLDIWSLGYKESGTFQLDSRRYIQSWDIWRNGAKRLTPGFKDRDWLEKRLSNSLLVHPLPDATAVACSPVIARQSKFSGAQVQLSLQEKAESVVFVRMILTTKMPSFTSENEAKIYAEALPETVEGEIVRSDWVEVPPGTARPLMVDSTGKFHEAFICFATTTRRGPIDYAHLICSDLTLFIDG